MQPSGSPEPPRTGHSTLGQILDRLGVGVLDMLVAPGGLDQVPGEPVVAGVGEPLPDRPGGVLLAVGSGADPLATERLIEAAGAAGYAAVVVKMHDRPTAGLIRAATRAGVVLLSTPDDMTWRHLDALLESASPAAGPAADRYASAGIGDLFGLANAIAAAVGGALTIEDPAGRVLAYSSLPHQEIDEIRRDAILGRQTPERPTNYAEYQAVFAHDGPLLFDSIGSGHAARMAVALWAGRQPLGIVWVIRDRPATASNAADLLADAARVAELHLLRLRGDRDPDRWRRTEALRDILEGRADGVGQATLGIDPATACRVLAIAPRHPDGHASTVPARIVNVVSLFCESWDQRAACVGIDGIVYALLPQSPGDRPNRVTQWSSDIVSTARRSADLSLLVAIGSSVTGTPQLSASRRSADRVLRHQRARLGADDRTAPPDFAAAVTCADDLAADMVLMSIADHLPAEVPVLPVVAALLGADDAGGTPYAQTALAYLGTMGDIARTAAALNVHENTVRYRVRRAVEMFGLDLFSPDQVLVTWLQLRLARAGVSPDRPVPAAHP